MAALALVALTAGAAAQVPNAAASTSCTASVITINPGSGAEAPSKAWGHTHRTGRHYIRAIYYGHLVEYWADNDGGWDGDTSDTYYGRVWC